MITEVHLPAKGTRASTTTRAFPLGEKNQPKRSRDLDANIRFLAVDRSPRYRPADGKTYCNIYAHDYCYLAGVFLPRVWWKPQALDQLEAGIIVEPKYDVTLDELNANALHDWLYKHGGDFGWQQPLSLDQLQAAADQGAVCLISAAQRDPRRSGHICVVAPQTDTVRALVRADHVALPVQSQAGVRNFQRATGVSKWWTAANYRSFGFWIHP